MPDDARIREQPQDVVFRHGGHALGIEPVEQLAESGPAAKDRDPRQTGLETLEAQLLVEGTRVALLGAPLLVVVATVLGIGGSPGAARHAVVSDDHRGTLGGFFTGFG